MFKRGAFDIGATVCPVAIKYNKIFVDAFWNSKRQSFTQHLLRLMTSWAVVCDVYFLEPQAKQEGESVDEFAARVQAMIARRAGLKVRPMPLSLLAAVGPAAALLDGTMSIACAAGSA